MIFAHNQHTKKLVRRAGSLDAIDSGAQMPVTDNGRPAFMNSRLESLDLSLPGGAVGVGATSPATQRESYLSGDDGTVPSLAGATPCASNNLKVCGVLAINDNQIKVHKSFVVFPSRQTRKSKYSFYPLPESYIFSGSRQIKGQSGVE